MKVAKLKMIREKGKPLLEILQFIFSNFWIWLGTVILLVAIPMPFRIVINERKDKENKSGKDDVN